MMPYHTFSKNGGFMKQLSASGGRHVSTYPRSEPRQSSQPISTSDCPIQGAMRLFSGARRTKSRRDFYERNDERPRRNHLSLVRPLPRSAKELPNFEKRNENGGHRDKHFKFTPQSLGFSGRQGQRGRREGHQKDYRKERFQRHDSSEAADSDSGTPQRMFREDWIRLRNEQATNPTIGGNTISKIPIAGYAVMETPARKSQRDLFAESFPPKKLECFIACLPGLEPILAQEMEDHGIACRIEAGGVIPTSEALTPESLMEFHMCLGTASHVLVRCGNPFVARGLPELKRKVSQLPWYEFLKEGSRLKFQVTSKKSKLNHNTAIRSAILDGINEAFQRKDANKSRMAVSLASEESEDHIRMVVRLERDEVLISVDSSETPIYKRGYRLATARAPLREDLAYAMVYNAGWKESGSYVDSKDHSRKYISFLDPFCGSGTLAIEAASIFAGLPPGRLRSAPFQGTTLYEPKAWRQRVGKVMRRAKRSNDNADDREAIVIAGSDRDNGAVSAARSNAERAGVDDYINFDCTPLSNHPWLQSPNDSASTRPAYPLLIVSNPPFGMRIAADNKNKNSRVQQLLPMYQTLLERQRQINKAGEKCSSMILLQDVKLFRKTGANFEVKFSTQHGGIPVAAVFTDGSV